MAKPTSFARKALTGGMAGVALRRANQRSASGGQSGGGFQGWFPPGDPMAPQAPKATAGRAFDFPVGVNLNYTPRQQQGQANISFEMLRRLADPAQGGLDLVRLAIETVKAEMKRQEFRIVSRNDKHDDGGDRARAVELLLRKPDGTTRWRAWLSSILEDHLVIDAPTIYYRVASLNGVRRPVFEQLDGSTITLLLDNSGRTPQPPLPAYQQVLHGLPAVDYQTTEIGYYVDNPRPGRIYGCGPVEQICAIITIALNRQLSVLNYFTAGSVPDMLIGVPSTWNTSQIAEFQEWWDSVLSGQIAENRKARFYPGEMKPVETKGEVLKNDFDEWLARIVCYAFSLSPESLVKQTNRATAETAKEAATEQGIQPRKLFVKDVIDDALERIGADDLQLQWVDDMITDPKERAEVAVALRGGTTGGALPAISLAEQREMLGLPPASGETLTELEEAALPPEPALPPGAPVDANGAPPKKNPKDEAAKRARGSLPPVKTTSVSRTTERKLKVIARRVLSGQRRALIAFVTSRPDVQKASDLPSEADLREWLGALDGKGWDEDVQREIRDLLARLAKERSTAALDHVADYVKGDDAEYMRLLEQANQRAVQWAQNRVGNLITQVSDTTRQAVNELAADAISEGLTNAELADRISEAFGFSDSRADMIARTETANAETQGTLSGYRESGVVELKEWSADELACDECEAMDGEQVGLEETFSDGSDGPPAHPDCVLGDTLIAPVGRVAGYTKRWFRGKVIRVSVRDQSDLTVTLNHPILTRRGWVRACELVSGDNVIYMASPISSTIDPQNQDVIASAEKRFDAAIMARGMATRRMPVAPEDFHGDGFADQYVDIVSPAGGLRPETQAGGAEILEKNLFVSSDSALEFFVRCRAIGQFFLRSSLPANRLVGSVSAASAGDGPSALRLESVPFADGSPRKTETFEGCQDQLMTASQAVGDLLQRFPSLVASVEVSGLVVVEYAGHVYNLETESGTYIANGFISHNCRCAVAPVITADASED